MAAPAMGRAVGDNDDANTSDEVPDLEHWYILFLASSAMRPFGSRPRIFPGWEKIRIFHPAGIYGQPAGSFLGGGGSFICGSSPLEGSRPKQKQIGEKVLLDLTKALTSMSGPLCRCAVRPLLGALSRFSE